MATFYASDKRDSLKEIIDESASLSKIDNIKGLLSSLSYIVFILNKNRQIVFANDLMLSKFDLGKDLKFLGQRPGESMNCVNVKNGPDGCGTSKQCRYCSNVNVILDVLDSRLPSKRETRMTVINGAYEKQLDLEVSASLLDYEETEYIVFSAIDITDKLRKEMLERTFFHDIINMAGNLDGIMEMMEDMDCEDRQRFLASAKRISNSLVEEIQAQRELVKAENNELVVKPQAYEINEIIKETVTSLSFHKVAKNKEIHFHPADDDYGIITDKVLLNRIVINLLKNALEAISVNNSIEITILKVKGGFKIEVHNDTVIPQNVQDQLFQRSFSTKGAGRGIGTYSIKLLGERYLKGKIGFESNQKQGTTFYIELPQKI